MEGTQPLSGVKVIELATFGFVPSGAAILADWGAEVIKVEHPRRPDPMRGLVAFSTPDGSQVDPLMDQFNRGKRNVALDLENERGLDVLYELVRRSQVFVTSFMAPTQRRLGVSYEHLHPVNPSLVFAHGHGYGPRGPDADQPGFDGISYWARGGVGHAVTFKDGPPAQQRPGFGDVIGGLAVAAGISAALHQTGVTGEGCTVDVSLLAVACWQLAPDILTSSLTGRDVQAAAPGPNSGPFRTSDGRFVTVLLLLPQYLGNVLRALDRDHLLAEPPFANFAGGLGSPDAAAIDATLRQAIGSFTCEEIRKRFSGQEIAWSVVQTPQEVPGDSQVRANEYVFPNPSRDGQLLVSGPVQFNQSRPRPNSGAPRQGEHTGEVLREFGFDQKAVEAMLADGVAVQGAHQHWDEYGRLIR
jgi:crotonobetainyl-CoA:carnitine CoA-transferase CaiB-like acyl-CoA transferase